MLLVQNKQKGLLGLCLTTSASLEGRRLWIPFLDPALFLGDVSFYTPVEPQRGRSTLPPMATPDRRKLPKSTQKHIVCACALLGPSACLAEFVSFGEFTAQWTKRLCQDKHESHFRATYPPSCASVKNGQVRVRDHTTNCTGFTRRDKFIDDVLGCFRSAG